MHTVSNVYVVKYRKFRITDYRGYLIGPYEICSGKYVGKN
jgi:hypothetical protein